MKRQYVTVLFSLICVIGFVPGARAQDEDTVVAKVPYDFVIGGQLLPAGAYRVSRVDSGGLRELIIRSSDTGVAVLVTPTVFAYAPHERAKLSLRPVAGTYFLTAIQTLNGVYTMAIPRSAIRLAQMEQRGASSSGSN